jgi:hypothetical protein
MISRRAVLSLSAAGVLSTQAIGSTFVDNESYEPVHGLCAFNRPGDDQMRSVVDQFAKRFNCHVTQVLTPNPRCCVWFEIIGDTNPDGSGWLFLHQSGGSICYATDIAEMRNAIKSMSEMAITIDGRQSLPSGVTTSYPTRRSG